MDIEAPAHQVWVGCTDDKPKGGNSLMMFYVLGKEFVYAFHLRRMDDVDFCLGREKEYLEVIKGAKTIRIVGGHHRVYEKKPHLKEGPRIPKKFVTGKTEISSVFLRLQAAKKCKAYFEDHCDLPKNYWANTIPNY